jgi:membrane protease YdiL (CAAX protease family)
LLAGVWRADVAARWYLFAAGYFAVIKLLAALIHRIGTGAWPAFGKESVALMLAAVVVSTPVQAGEEIGWRGYALPRMAARLGYGPASIVLGVIWSAWHLPFFLMTAGADKYQQSFPLYLAATTALSVAMAFLYVRSGGSVLLTMLMHAAVNNTKDIVPTAPGAGHGVLSFQASSVGWISAALMWLCAAYCLVRLRGCRVLTGPSVAPVQSGSAAIPPRRSRPSTATAAGSSTPPRPDGTTGSA